MECEGVRAYADSILQEVSGVQLDYLELPFASFPGCTRVLLLVIPDAVLGFFGSVIPGPFS